MNRSIEDFKRLIPLIGETLGSTFAATLYDLKEPGHPVIASTERYSDSHTPIYPLLDEICSSPKVLARGTCLNRQVADEFGNLRKVSLLFLSDEDGSPCAAFALEVHCSTFMRLFPFVSDMIRFDINDLDSVSLEPDSADEFSGSEPPSLKTIDAVIEEMGIEPGRISQSERIEIITDLYDMGVFELKGAVAHTAQALEISEQSVYRYLSKIRRMRG